MKSPEELTYSEQARKGLGNPRLQKSLKNNANHFGKGALGYWAAMSDTRLRERVKKARMATLQNLDVVLTLLADNIVHNGGHVYFAKNGEEAVDYCLRVAKKNDVQRIVKGKSMISEEIGIDSALKKEDIEVVETDLGEFIVQLAGDKPSHIVAPCLHLDRQHIGRIFAEKLGIEYSDYQWTLLSFCSKVWAAAAETVYS